MAQLRQGIIFGEEGHSWRSATVGGNKRCLQPSDTAFNCESRSRQYVTQPSCRLTLLELYFRMVVQHVGELDQTRMHLLYVLHNLLLHNLNVCNRHHDKPPARGNPPSSPRWRLHRTAIELAYV